uniref:Uncharacterized protein n=1 Tax=Arundo donax TaxID=35708 RepID=A0A0A9CGN0_ARUDO
MFTFVCAVVILGFDKQSILHSYSGDYLYKPITIGNSLCTSRLLCFLR